MKDSADVLQAGVSDASNLRDRASAHGRSAEAEARVILREALDESKEATWTPINDFRARLAASGKSFSDSTDLIREDRSR